jgi:hypothetical protein
LERWPWFGWNKPGKSSHGIAAVLIRRNPEITAFGTSARLMSLGKPTSIERKSSARLRMLVHYQQIRDKKPLIINDVERYASCHPIGRTRHWQITHRRDNPATIE